jgi:hypothetical protein
LASTIRIRPRLGHLRNPRLSLFSCRALVLRWSRRLSRSCRPSRGTPRLLLRRRQLRCPRLLLLPFRLITTCGTIRGHRPALLLLRRLCLLLLALPTPVLRSRSLLGLACLAAGCRLPSSLPRLPPRLRPRLLLSRPGVLMARLVAGLVVVKRFVFSPLFWCFGLGLIISLFS